MKQYRQLILTILIGIIAVIYDFILFNQLFALTLVTLNATIITLFMIKDMYHDIKNGYYGVDILALTAILVTWFVGDYWATYLILVMMATGEALETFAEKRASRELESLISNSPRIAHQIYTNSKGKNEIRDIPVDDIKIGDILLIKPSEVIPIDGTIISGQTYIDESSITGEAKPIEKTVNDTVLSGAINANVSIKIKTTKLAKESQYQSLVCLVEKFKEQPGQFVRIADYYAVPFTIISYIIAISAWLISGDIHRLAQVLVVATPCPLLLAAPIAMVAGMSQSSKEGILVKSGSVLEKLNRATKIAFDKTGTLTMGQLLVDSITLSNETELTKEEVIQLAASLEQESSHILARSLINKAKAENINLLPVKNLKEVVAEGVQGVINHDVIKVGKASFVNAPIAEQKDQTAIYISVNNHYIGRITFNDLVRPESAQTIQLLKNLGVKDSYMLTGDKSTIAQSIGSKLNLSGIYADLLPEDKINILKQFKNKRQTIIMVGDGVNDAPALAMADVGIAMGAHGASAASESADAVILKDSINEAASVVRISKSTLKIAKEAVLIGIGLSVILMLIASTGMIPTIVGAMLQEVVDVISMVWALRAYYH